MKESVIDDPELRAMGRVLEALSPFDPATQIRVLQWTAAKLGVSMPSTLSTVRSVGATSVQGSEPQPVRFEGTVSTVAFKLGADSCRTLLLAAAVHLTLYQGKDSFARAEWIACAREARPWKADYNQQIPTIISRLLTGGTIFEKARDVFSVDAKFLAEQEAKLAT